MGVINITDSRPEHVRAMLQFIYTGTVDNIALENFAEGILAIADKYAIMTLKERCERFLASTINAKNVASLCLVADTYFASLLKKSCTKFISTNHKSVLRSPEWKELKTHRGTLANELLESVLDQTGGESMLETGSGSSSFDTGNTDTMGAGSFASNNFGSYLFTRNNTPAISADLTSSFSASSASSSFGNNTSGASTAPSAFQSQSQSSSSSSTTAAQPTFGQAGNSAPSVSASSSSSSISQQQQQQATDSAGDEDSRTPVRKRLRRKL